MPKECAEEWWCAYEKVLKDFQENHPGEGDYQEIVATADKEVIPWDDNGMGNITIEPNMSLRGHFYGLRGHRTTMRQVLFKGAHNFGWSWMRGLTEPTLHAPEGQIGLQPPCYYQMSFAAVSYGVSPWGTEKLTGIDTGAKDLPIKVGQDQLESLVVEHDITYVADDDNPGRPSRHYARHCLIYDLFLLSEKPDSTNKMKKVTDEIIIMMNYNEGYTDFETCDPVTMTRGESMSEPVERNAVFDGFHHYHYQSVTNLDVPAPGVRCYYHQFRRKGGDIPGAAVPEKIDLASFFHYLQKRNHTEGKWMGQITIGSNIYDHTHGSVTFNSKPKYHIKSR